MDSNRLTSLEESDAHQAAALDDVAKQMADQWAAIRRLEKKMDLIITHLREMKDSDTEPGEIIDRPPHY